MTKEHEAASAGEYRAEGACGNRKILHADSFRPKQKTSGRYSIMGTLYSEANCLPTTSQRCWFILNRKVISRAAGFCQRLIDDEHVIGSRRCRIHAHAQETEQLKQVLCIDLLDCIGIYIKNSICFHVDFLFLPFYCARKKKSIAFDYDSVQSCNLVCEKEDFASVGLSKRTGHLGHAHLIFFAIVSQKERFVPVFHVHESPSFL